MPWTQIGAIALWTASLLVAWIGLRWIVRGAGAAGHPEQSSWVIRGFRRLILAGGLQCFGFGLWFSMNELYWLGAFFLLEELVETTIQGAAARRGAQLQRERRPPDES